MVDMILNDRRTPVTYKSARSSASGSKENAAGMDIIMIGYAGLAGAIRLFFEHETEIRGHFSPSFTELFIKESEECISGVHEAEKQLESAGVTGIHAAGEGGIYAALWDFAGGYGCGLRVFHKDIPVRQDTIEICELYGEDPYMIYSEGCFLLASDRANMLARRLSSGGCPANVIGYFTDDNDRVIINGEDRRYLTPYRG